MPNKRYWIVKVLESTHLPLHHCSPISIGRTLTVSLLSFTGFENNGLPNLAHREIFHNFLHPTYALTGRTRFLL